MRMRIKHDMEMEMNVASAFAKLTKDEIKALLDGGKLTIYSVARPISADHAVDRSVELVSFTFATPAFGAELGDFETPAFVANPVVRDACRHARLRPRRHGRRRRSRRFLGRTWRA